MSAPANTHVLGIDGTRLTLDGRPFPYQGLSFFNAVFNRTAADRSAWLRTFADNGVNALRVWCQWDFSPPRTYVDTAPGQTLYTPAGDVRDERFQALAALIEAADRLEMVIEVTLFAQEKEPNLPVTAQARAAREMARRLAPYRNLILQIWNEQSTEVRRHFEAIKEEDPARLVTNSPGKARVLGDDEQNRLLDLLTPHTGRRGAEPFWDVAPQQVAALLDRYAKPVIDEPARTGLALFGGIPEGTTPEQHIQQIRRVRAAGGYHVYHHDMFQQPSGSPATPPNGLPDPDFSPFHRRVFDYLRTSGKAGS